MSQPSWKFLENLGDASPLEYGGLFVYVDTTGVFPAEMERVELEDEEAETDSTRYVVHRVVLERCSFIDGVLSDNEHHRALPAWFAKDLHFVAASQDYPIDELRADFCDENPLARARAWRAVLDHHGWANGDSEPLTLTRAEAEERYREIVA